MVVALLSACATTRLSMRPTPRAFTARDYSDVYQRWTRSEDEFAFGTLSSVLHVTATFESWEFRWAYVIRYGSDFALDTDARTAMLRASLADAQAHHRFFVTLAGPVYRESDLTSAASAWRVLLVDDHGHRTVPLDIKKIARPTAADRTYFPSVSPYRQAFRIVFPAQRPDGTPTIPSSSHYVLLRFTGALGTVDLRWDLVPPSA